jgi:hypothetical protein
MEQIYGSFSFECLGRLLPEGCRATGTPPLTTAGFSSRYPANIQPATAPETDDDLMMICACGAMILGVVLKPATIRKTTISDD